MTQITVKQMAAVKRTAMNVLPLTNKKAKLQAKIAEMEAEIKSLNEQIDVQQGYVKSFAGGLTTEQLVVRNENKVFEPNTDVVYFDEEKRVYIVKEEEHNDPDAGAMPSAEEAEAAEKARLEAEAAEQERLQEEEAARLKAEEEAEEARRQEEIRAAKERLTASKPAGDADPFAV